MIRFRTTWSEGHLINKLTAFRYKISVIASGRFNIHPNNEKLMTKYLKDTLYKKSSFVVLSNMLDAVCGFFWMQAARLYTMEDVGLATALVSSLGLVVLFSVVEIELYTLTTIRSGTRLFISNYEGERITEYEIGLFGDVERRSISILLFQYLHSITGTI
jgi:hypothetical protein